MNKVYQLRGIGFVFDLDLRRAWWPTARFPYAAHNRETNIRKANEAA